MAPRAQRAAALKVSEQEVLAAIESLYRDGIRPQGRLLLKRLGERLAAESTEQRQAVPLPTSVLGRAAGAEVVPRIDTAHLRRVCEQSPSVEIVPEASGEYMALLTSRADVSFVDPCSAEDPFPEGLWAEMAAHFQESPAVGLRLPGGRYACARALVAEELPFLAGRSLGEVCHIVQLAVSHRKILGYLDGQVVPYGQSEAVVKQQSASLQQPTWALKKDALPVADLSGARQCLQAILASPGAEEGGVPLPNVKRLFRSRFQLELSETALGHCRLSDLLQDARFHDICTLQQRGNSYVVVQPECPATGVTYEPRKQCDPSPCQDASPEWSLFSTPRDTISTAASESDSSSPVRLCTTPDEACCTEEGFVSFDGIVGFPLLTPSPHHGVSCFATQSPACSGASPGTWSASPGTSLGAGCRTPTSPALLGTRGRAPAPLPAGRRARPRGGAWEVAPSCVPAPPGLAPVLNPGAWDAESRVDESAAFLSTLWATDRAAIEAIVEDPDVDEDEAHERMRLCDEPLCLERVGHAGPPEYSGCWVADLALAAYVTGPVPAVWPAAIAAAAGGAGPCSPWAFAESPPGLGCLGQLPPLLTAGA